MKPIIPYSEWIKTTMSACRWFGGCRINGEWYYIEPTSQALVIEELAEYIDKYGIRRVVDAIKEETDIKKIQKILDDESKN